MNTNNKTEKNKKINTEKYIGIAIFSALSVIVALVCNVIPPIAGFLSLDAKDAIIAIASFIYGPVSAVAISLIAAFIELVTFSTTGWYGFVMNFASSAVFSITASLIYRKRRNINGALISFFGAVIMATGVMLLLNIFVTPLYLVSYLGMPSEIAKSEVMGMLPSILLPFNLAKALMNSAIAMFLYKPLATALKRTRLLAGGEGGMKFNRNSVIIVTVGGAALIASVVIFIILSL